MFGCVLTTENKRIWMNEWLTYLLTNVIGGDNSCGQRRRWFWKWRDIDDTDDDELVQLLSTPITFVCSCTDASTTKLLGTWRTTAHQYPTSPIVNGYVLPVVMKSLFHGTGSVPTDVGHLPLLAGLELFARGHAWSGCFWGQLQAVTEDVFIFALLVCSAH